MEASRGDNACPPCPSPVKPVKWTASSEATIANNPPKKNFRVIGKMAAGTPVLGENRRHKLMFIEGTFEELSREFAEFLNIADEVNPLLEKNQNDEVLKKLVMASPAIHSMPEANFEPSYNLLIYLVLESPNAKIFLPRICDHLCTKPITSSPVNGPHLALFTLQTIFNLLDEDSDLRYNAFGAILRFVKDHGQFEVLKDSLDNVPRWLDQWKTKPAERRSLYVKIADTALSAVEQSPDAAQIKSNEQVAYTFLQKAIGLFTSDEASSSEAQKLALRIVRMALLSNHKYTFNELTALPAVQGLADTHPIWSQLLEIFSEQDLEDYIDFLDEHPDFVEEEGLDGDKLQEKMRLLTFASLAAHAASGSREIQYKQISKALQIPMEEVEMWAIDAIRAKLVEGKLNQKRQTFGVHRATYRVFSEKQWRELATRIQTTKQMIVNVIGVLDRGEKDQEAQQKRDLEEVNKKLSGVNMGGDTRGGGNRRREYQKRQDNDD